MANLEVGQIDAAPPLTPTSSGSILERSRHGYAFQVITNPDAVYGGPPDNNARTGRRYAGHHRRGPVRRASRRPRARVVVVA